MPSNMKKETFYRILIGILLVLNLLQIGFFLFAKPPHPPKHKFRGRAPEILHLSEEQKFQFHNIARAHHKNMELFNGEEKKLIELYFEEESEEHLHQIQYIQQQKLEFTKAHFEDIRAMLEENQLSYFNEFKQEALQRIMR